MPKSETTCGCLIIFGPGFILLVVGLCLSSPKHLPALFWISVFGPILVPVCWMAIILLLCPGSSTPPGGQQGTVVNQQNGQHESSNTVSISPSIVASFPTYIYLQEASKGDRHCSLCKKFMQQGELATRMPVCIHSFHKSCIDEWFKANICCPDCGLKLDPLPGEVAIIIQ